MKTSAIISPLASLVLLAFATIPVRATDATYGNLTVTGTGDFQGASTMFGTWSSGSNGPGYTLYYSDGGTTGTINFIGSGSSTVWQWWDYNGTQNSAPAMQLDQNNQLILYTSGTSGTIGIILNPYTSGTSIFNGSVTISGSVNTMPNQTLTGGTSSILTESLGDGRYLPLSATSSFVSSSDFVAGTGTDGSTTGPIFALGGATATGPYSLAAGNSASASGDYSTAIGYGTITSGYQSNAFGYSSSAVGDSSIAIGSSGTAQGSDSIAIGAGANTSTDFSIAIGGNAYAAGFASFSIGFDSAANGYSSIAFGNFANANGDNSNAIGEDAYSWGSYSNAIGSNSYAMGDYSNAIGYSTSANGDDSNAIGNYSYAGGDYSTASGYSSIANGQYSTAAGPFTYAQGYGQFIVGQYNVVRGSGTSWVGAEDLFVVGNGINSSTPSNAFVVNKNGDTTVYGGLTISGTSGIQNTITNGGWAVTGTSVPVVVGSGTVNTVVATGTNNLMLVPQQGDLSMGPYVEGAQPPAQ